MNQINFHPLQSNEWEIFRQKWGNETTRVNGLLLTLHKVPFLNKKVAILEKGPEPTQEIIDSLKKFGQKNNLIFIKLEPNVLKNDKTIKHLKKNKLIPGKTIFTPTTFWINLNRSEDELLKSFHPKTRYNIRLAIKKGVTVHEDSSDKAFESYLKLMEETVKRDQFYAHNKKYHQLMWQSLKEKIAHLLIAKYNNEVVTAWIVFTKDNFLYYPYGASTHKYKNLMANNLMMWEAIKFGKRKNLKTFDLWGRETGKGFTKFKEGYNPQVIELIGTWDLIINKPFYYLYKTLESLRWIFLRLKSTIVKPTF